MAAEIRTIIGLYVLVWCLARHPEQTNYIYIMNKLHYYICNCADNKILL